MARVFLTMIVLLVAGCIGPAVQVTRFHSLPVQPEGKSVAIRAADPDKGDSLEFRHYAALAAEALARVGYPPPKPGGEPDLVARLAWKVDSGRTQQYSTPIYGPLGPGHFVRRQAADGRVVSVYVPPPQGVVDVAVDTRTVYDVVLTLDIAEARAEGRTRFEGRANAVTGSPDIAPVMPLLLRAMMSGFPGNSGSTVVVQPEN